MDWNPRSSESWANLLGLVNVPLFGNGGDRSHRGAILLDGQRGTFAFFDVSDHDAQVTDEMLSWAWSANALHAVAVGTNGDRLHVKRWDSTRSRALKLPTKGLEAEAIFDDLEASPKARAATVVQHVLHGFRLIRDTLSDSATLQAVQMLNAFLLAAARATNDPALRNRLENATVLHDVVALLPEHDRDFVGEEVAELPRDHPIGAIPQHFLNPEPRTSCQLAPDLLFRHASTQLYQEAHLEIERGEQSYFAGLAPVDRPKGVAPKDVRFTPSNLARVLVEQAINAYGPLPDDLVVLDPACGSGVFLQQCLRQLTATSFRGNVSLHGYDISPIAACISRFCLDGPVREALSPGLEANVQIRTGNSLTIDQWASAHLVLMNPPFISRAYLAEAELQQINDVLGDLAKGRVDMAMAFVWKAVQCLREGGVFATVLPTGLLENEWGAAWREAIAAICEVHLLGRFEGYKYFSTSMVETAFAVFRKRASATAQPSTRVAILIAEEGREDAAVRCLRLKQRGVQRDVEGIDLYEASAAQLRTGDRWTPLRQGQYLLREWTQSCALPTVGSLFSVHQGIRTRYKPAFVLGSKAYHDLPDSERPYFRPAAGQKTIADGRLFDREYVFYPYDKAGLLIHTEAQLKKRVPAYLKTHLSRFRPKLTGDQWWALFRSRTWQWCKQPKLVSKTFGTAGDFAFDQSGDYAVVQGCAWRWKNPTSDGFVAEPLQFAYLALLNCRIFNTLLSVFCRRVQGGQFEIANKYVASIPLPDLTREDSTTTALVTELADLGETIHDHGLSAVEQEIDPIVASAYGLPDEVADALVRVGQEGDHARGT